MNRLPSPRPSFTPCLLALGVGLVMTGGAGCNTFHNLGTGPHMEKSHEVEHRPTNTKPRDMVVEITTDAQGAVTNVAFQHSSGSEAVDDYVAESIRSGWPGQPSTRALVELTYSADKGFAKPRMLSSSPVP